MAAFFFPDSSLFHATTCNHAGFEFVKFSRDCLFGFEDKFDWDNEFIFAGFCTKDERFVINVLDFHFDCMKPSGANVIIKFEGSFE